MTAHDDVGEKIKAHDDIRDKDKAS